MKKVLMVGIGLLVLVYATALAITIDPDNQRPGTRLSGTLVDEANPDWSFVSERQEVQIQTSTWYLIPHSVTTISFVRDNQFYVPCGRCASKRWPKNVAADPSVVLKIGNKLYARTAVKIPEESERRHLLGIAHGEPTPSFELYRLDPS